MTTTDCPPLAVRVTRSLLGYGVLAGPFYVAVAGLQMIFRDGYDPTRHAVSQLTNGDFGWIQTLNFVLTGAMVVAAAVGFRRALGAGGLSAAASALLGAYGVALIAAGSFPADPGNGFPPGSPTGPAQISWHGAAHLAVSAVGFVCVTAACVAMSRWFTRRSSRGWAGFSLVTGIAFGASFVALASGTAGATTILAFTAALLLLWTWLAAVSVHLYRSAG